MTTDADTTPAFPAIAFLGAGSMGSAILEGLLASGADVTAGIRITNRAPSARAWPAGVTALATQLDADANCTAVSGAGIVVVGVKPGMVADLLAEVGDAIAPGAVVVSVAVGLTTENLESYLPPATAVVRAMPNTPSAVGRGVAGLARGIAVTDAQFDLAVRLFDAVGEAVVVPEDRMVALGAVSGSGPAYVYLLVEQLTRAAVGVGFSEEDAARLVQGTFSGAVELLRQSGKEPAQLRREVTSPNGTTEQAIRVLSEAGLDEVFGEALAAAIRRSEEIAAGD